jgi:hypothetical protein
MAEREQVGGKKDRDEAVGERAQRARREHEGGAAAGHSASVLAPHAEPPRLPRKRPAAHVQRLPGDVARARAGACATRATARAPLPPRGLEWVTSVTFGTGYAAAPCATASGAPASAQMTAHARVAPGRCTAPTTS